MQQRHPWKPFFSEKSARFYDIFREIREKMKKFRTIYADPPWPMYGGGRIKRGSDKYYHLMGVKNIKRLPVNRIAETNCHLYLWTTNNYIKEGIEVMEFWGFRYITTITWVKDKIGLGQYFRGLTEHCLFGVRGILPYKIINGKRAQGETAFFTKKGKHSEKPEEMRQMIELVSYSPRIELFARKKVRGWYCWGDSLTKKDLISYCKED